MTPCRTHLVLISLRVGERVQNRLFEHEGRVLERKVICFRALCLCGKFLSYAGNLTLLGVGILCILPRLHIVGLHFLRDS